MFLINIRRLIIYNKLPNSKKYIHCIRTSDISNWSICIFILDSCNFAGKCIYNNVKVAFDLWRAVKKVYIIYNITWNTCSESLKKYKLLFSYLINYGFIYLILLKLTTNTMLVTESCNPTLHPKWLAMSPIAAVRTPMTKILQTNDK